MGLTAVIVVVSLGLSGYALVHSLRRERRDAAVRAEARESGLIEPASLHPSIDPETCIGCASCVEACPEKEVLGVVEGRAELVQPSACIGHGACRDACPTGSITLVFGTARRGVDIPVLSPQFETNVPGIYIAGELGGMGLIRNAVEQGRQAVEAIASADRGRDDVLDLLIVGAGPAGFSASLAAMQHGLRFVTLEQETLGGSVAHYPRGKLVMTSPVRLPLIGKVPFRETTKERLLEFWKEAERKTGLEVRYGERLEAMTGVAGNFEVTSSRGVYRARRILLAIGRRGTPRKLEVPGEDRTKVVYRVIDPEQYRDHRVLVVGGGDSAIEAATTIAEERGTSVSLSYRGQAFNRVKAGNRDRLARLADRLNVLLESRVCCIEPESVEIEHQGRRIGLDNDAVVVCAGGILPTPFLTKLGIEVQTKHGTA